MMDNCPYRYFNEKPKNRFFIKAKGKERKNTPRPSVWMGAVLLSEIGTLGKKLEKQGLFLTISDKLHNVRQVFMVNFALVLRFGIGYNVVTKVTASCFWLS
ncbi:MAG: hypothetical protein HFF44_03465 [Lawsonibacter sp.]|nr:hypothetical protein [Lawsonibacter sp.]